MGIQQKIKGKKFESDVAKFLNECFDSEEFFRTPLSGAFTGRSNFQRFENISDDIVNAYVGDVVCPKEYPFTIECKHYKDLPKHNNIMKMVGDATLDKWIGESIVDGYNNNKIPIVVFKTNNKGTYCCLPKQMIGNVTPDVVVHYKGFVVMDTDTFKSLVDEFRHQLRWFSGDVRNHLIYVNKKYKFVDCDLLPDEIVNGVGVKVDDGT